MKKYQKLTYISRVKKQRESQHKSTKKELDWGTRDPVYCGLKITSPRSFIARKVHRDGTVSPKKSFFLKISHEKSPASWSAIFMGGGGFWWDVPTVLWRKHFWRFFWIQSTRLKPLSVGPINIIRLVNIYVLKSLPIFASLLCCALALRATFCTFFSNGTEVRLVFPVEFFAHRKIAPEKLTYVFRWIF